MRGTWTIAKYTGGTWVDDGTIYRPNEDFAIDIVSTQAKLRLANGSNAFVTPETFYIRDPLTFTWLELVYNDALIAKVENYIKNHDYLKITDHLGDTYIGRFINLHQVWISGQADSFDLQGIFEVQINA